MLDRNGIPVPSADRPRPLTRELQARSACLIGQSCEWRLFRNCPERTARSAPSGWRIAFQVRIAERSGIPPVRARRSGGPVQAEYGPRTLRPGPAANVPLGVISAFAPCDVIAEPGDAVQQTFVLQQAHRPSAGLPGMAMLAAQPGDARRGRAGRQDLAGDHLAEHPSDAHVGARVRRDCGARRSSWRASRRSKA